ncbi:MAG: protein translocase subunit SecF [Candidatus Aenigmarchaeota archaeon]|nr:protein translocase subunit SecF [Candidatus Aenigmarchaeota archaeon]
MFTFRTLYSKIGLKNLMIFHVVIILLAIGTLVFYHQTTGEWFNRSFELKGGVQMNIDDITAEPSDIEKALASIDGASVRGYTSVATKGVSINAPAEIDEATILNKLKAAGIDAKAYSFQVVGPTLGEGFWSQSVYAFALAFIFMGIIAFIMFRSVAPSLAVIQAACADIIVALAGMRLFGMELSLAAFSALLLMVGYSIDTDILLTNKMLRKEGKFIDKLTEATRTGLTMTSTAMAAVTVLYFATSANAIRDISSTLLIAMVADIPATWFMNAGILHWWMAKKGMIDKQDEGWVPK